MVMVVRVVGGDGWVVVGAGWTRCDGDDGWMDGWWRADGMGGWWMGDGWRWMDGARWDGMVVVRWW